MERLTERTAGGIAVKEDYGEDVLKTVYQCYGAEPMPHYANCEEGYCAMEKLAEYEDLDEKGRVLTEDAQIQYDKSARVSYYLIEKYGDELWKEFGFEKTGNAVKDMFSIMAIFEKIYETEKKKYPLMWYEYGFGSSQPFGDK